MVCIMSPAAGHAWHPKLTGMPVLSLPGGRSVGGAQISDSSEILPCPETS